MTKHTETPWQEAIAANTPPTCVNCKVIGTRHRIALCSKHSAHDALVAALKSARGTLISMNKSTAFIDEVLDETQ